MAVLCYRNIMKKTIMISTPLNVKDIIKLRAGDRVLLTGTIYTARDMAHKKLVETIMLKKKLPFDLNGQIIFYAGPTPAKPGSITGSIGPTTSYRMDKYTPILLKNGLKGMIGKGQRSQAVKDSIKKYKAVYFAAVGGVSALLARKVKRSEVIAYDCLGAEAVRKLYVEGFPLIVAGDASGDDLYYKGIIKHD